MRLTTTQLRKENPKGLSEQECEICLKDKLDKNLYSIIVQSIRLAYGRGRLAEQVNKKIKLKPEILNMEDNDD